LAILSLPSKPFNVVKVILYAKLAPLHINLDRYQTTYCAPCKLATCLIETDV
jgi:hypothetical protein